MIAMTDDEVREFLKGYSTLNDLTISADGQNIFFANKEANCIDLRYPETPLRTTYFVRVVSMLSLEAEDFFDGAILWFRYWEGGSPQLVKSGWKLIEKLRLAYGETRPLSLAPGHSFDGSEFLDLNSFLLPCFVFGWDVYLIPANSDHFVFISHDDFWSVVARNRQTHTRLMDELSDLNPIPGLASSVARFCSREPK